MKKVAIVLGGTVPHVELVRQLRGRGYYVILVDYLQDSPAKSVANEHIQESTLDQEAVLRVARERKATLVICGAIDQANITACYVMEQLGLKPPYSYQTALLATNKTEMKRVMLENGIPTSRFINAKSVQELSTPGLKLPVMVKPADSNSANGVKRANDWDSARKYFVEAQKISRNGLAIVEEFVEGREISAYCYVQGGRARLLQTAERLSLTDNGVIKCYSSVAPAMISKCAERNAERIATQIARAFGLDNTPLFFQGIVNGDDIQVIEFAPRVAGGISFATIKTNTGFDMISGVIDSYLGIPVELNATTPTSILTVNTFYATNGVYAHTIGGETLLEDGTIEQFFLHKKPGAVIDNASASKSRIGAFITKAKSLEETYDKVLRAFSILKVRDENNRDMLRPEINIARIYGGISE